jgi:hemolysin III
VYFFCHARYKDKNYPVAGRTIEEMQATDQSIGEEIANSVSHGIGAMLAVAGLVLLTIRAASVGGARHVVCATIFGASAIMLYLASTLYHSLSHTRAYRVMLSFDHCSIYLLIAGTYTPVTLLGLRGLLGWTLFGAVWGCAAIGIVVKSFFAGRWELASTALYLAMGWAAIFAVKSMYLMLARPVFFLLMAGGMCYSAGIPFFASKRKYMHFVWHLWVLAGTACHFAAIWILMR